MKQISPEGKELSAAAKTEYEKVAEDHFPAWMFVQRVWQHKYVTGVLLHSEEEDIWDELAVDEAFLNQKFPEVADFVMCPYGLITYLYCSILYSKVRFSTTEPDAVKGDMAFYWGLIDAMMDISSGQFSFDVMEESGWGITTSDIMVELIDPLNLILTYERWYENHELGKPWICPFFKNNYYLEDNFPTEDDYTSTTVLKIAAFGIHGANNLDNVATMKHVLVGFIC